MFEKESEEYANEYGQDAFTQFNMPQMIEPIRMVRKLGFQKGAEFGYNFAKEEIDYLNKHWRSEEERNFNEWHYVKDGDLPNTEFGRADVAIAYINAYENPCKMDCCFDGTNFIYWDDRKPIGWKKADIFGKIYAWKYSEKLPELPKEIE